MNNLNHLDNNKKINENDNLDYNNKINDLVDAKIQVYENNIDESIKLVDDKKKQVEDNKPYDSFILAEAKIINDENNLCENVEDEDIKQDQDLILFESKNKNKKD